MSIIKNFDARNMKEMGKKFLNEIVQKKIGAFERKAVNACDIEKKHFVVKIGFV